MKQFERDLADVIVTVPELSRFTGMNPETILARIDNGQVTLHDELKGRIRRMKLGEAVKQLFNCYKHGGPQNRSSADRDHLGHAKSELEYWKAKNEERKYREAVRELIPSDEVFRTYSRVFKELHELLSSLPDVIERECGLDQKQFDSLDRELNSFRSGWIEKMRQLQQEEASAAPVQFPAEEAA